MFLILEANVMFFFFKYAVLCHFFDSGFHLCTVLVRSFFSLLFGTFLMLQLS